MKNIRSALAAGLLLFGGAMVASAQQTTGAAPAPGHGTHAKRAHGPRNPALNGMTLSAAEKANIKAVRSKYAPQLRNARGSQMTADQRAQAKQLRLSEQNEIRSALSPANQAKFDANVARMRKRRQAH